MDSFFNDYETELSKEFIENGFIIKKTNNTNALNFLQNHFIKNSSKILDEKVNVCNEDWLNNIHNKVKVDELNNFRLKMIHSSNNEEMFKINYYHAAKKYLDIIAGNELAMQIRVNLSIQFPNDNSSLLPVHADTWSGDSPFEIVVWIPLVDCYKTKTMFILPPHKTKKLNESFNQFVGKSSKNLFDNIKDEVEWLDVKFGEILIFNQSLPHGNIVNKERETRWSMNCRFKSIFSPYSDKKLGEFFEPITLKPASKVGMNYSLPKLMK
jgi:sporadic carbohydrate cluster 2OG-Fe(II) oxygenase